jgi:hypothetical protein
MRPGSYAPMRAWADAPVAGYVLAGLSYRLGLVYLCDKSQGGGDLLEEQLLEEFARRLRAEAMEKLGEVDARASLANDVALVDVMLAYLEEAGTVGEHELCAHEDATGRNRCRIIAYSLPEDSNRLELFTGIFLAEGEGQTLPPDEIRRLTGQAARFFEYAAKGDFTRFLDNEEGSAAARHIAAEMDRIEEVRVYVLTNGMVRDRAVTTIHILERPVEFSVFDLERLFRSSQEEVTRDRIEVDFASELGRPIACLEMRPPPTEYQTFLLVLPGNLIASLYEKFGARLFEFNVRSFLQAKGKVNKGLRETLRSQPERFLAYNNGITATADEIEVGLLNGETVIKRVKGLQIVNGAQTTASIHRAKKIDRVSVDSIRALGGAATLPSLRLRRRISRWAEGPARSRCRTRRLRRSSSRPPGR